MTRSSSKTVVALYAKYATKLVARFGLSRIVFAAIRRNDTHSGRILAGLGITTD